MTTEERQLLELPPTSTNNSSLQSTSGFLSGGDNAENSQQSGNQNSLDNSVTRDTSLDSPISSANNTNSTTSNNNGSRILGNSSRRGRAGRVRRNFISHFNQLTSSSKFVLIFLLVVYLILIVAGISVAVVSSNNGEGCDEPLLAFIIVYILRFALSFPLQIYNTLFDRSSLSSSSVENESASREETSASQNNTARPSSQQRQRQQQQRTPSLPLRIKNMLDTFGLIWFVLGNWWVFGSDTCPIDAPFQYRLSLAYVIIGYVSLLFPLILILCVIFCLPLIILALRVVSSVTGIDLTPRQFHPNNPTHSRMQPATPSIIQSLPTEQYHSSSNTIPKEDAHCVICLADYSDGEVLKRLPTCNHHFHSGCVDEWLNVNRSCPLCVRDVELEVRNKQESLVAVKPIGNA